MYKCEEKNTSSPRFQDIKYTINSDQYDSLEHYKNMFRNIAEDISDLCSSEKDDINMGYHLGKMYKYSMDFNSEMFDLLKEIKDTKNVD